MAGAGGSGNNDAVVESGDGEVTAIDTDDASQVWQKSVNLPIYGTSIDSDGTVYAGTFAVDTSSKNDVIAFEPDDGTEKWRYNIGRPVWMSATHSGDGSVLYAVTGHDSSSVNGSISSNGELHAIDTSDGSKEWDFVPSDDAGITDSSTRVFTPAVASDGTVYLANNDGNVFALDPADGSIKWEQSLASGEIVGSFALGSDGTVYVLDFGDTVYALDSSDGSTNWTTDASALGGDLAADAQALTLDDQDNLYVAHSDGVSRLDTDNNGSEDWYYSISESPTVNSGPVLGNDGKLYFGTGTNTDGRLYVVE